MQRFFTFFLIALAGMLTSCVSTSPQPASPQQRSQLPSPASSTTDAKTSPYVVSPMLPATAVTSFPDTAPAKAGGQVGLILPLKSATFGLAANAVKQGFMAAFAFQPKNHRFSVKVYATDDQPGSMLDAYQLAIQEGSQIIIGPLTRNGVTKIAGSGLVNVPTLALNIPENDTALPPNLYFFGLSVEGEARQVAHIAFKQGKTTATTITANTPLAKRSQQAFMEEWEKLGGTLIAQYSFTDDINSFSTLRGALSNNLPDMIFLSADYRKARLVRPYLGAPIPTYATSQINSGRNEPSRDVDLNDIQFVDMPWLLQQDHPAVMIYPRMEKFISADLERLYALGIDAYRLAEIMLFSPTSRTVALDGVTGKITLSTDQQIIRELTPAIFRQGIATLPDATSSPDAPTP